MSLRDHIPYEDLSEGDWQEVEEAVFAEVDSGGGGMPAPKATPRARRRLQAGVALTAAVAAAAAIIVLWPSTPAPAVLSTSRVATGAEPATATLGEVTLELGPWTELVGVGSDEAGRVVTLERGRALFAVPARRGRPPFRVQAAGVRVEVVGTRFWVERDADDVAVGVERGVVRVVRAGETVVLRAGERWPARTDSETADDAISLPEPAVGERMETGVSETAGSRSTAPIEAVERASESTSRQIVSRTSAELYAEAEALESSDPQRSVAHYRAVARRGDSWGAAALFAEARVELERGRSERARHLLTRYLERFPEGLNARDARRLLRRVPGRLR